MRGVFQVHMATHAAAPTAIHSGVATRALVAPDLPGRVAQEQVNNGLQQGFVVLHVSAHTPQRGLKESQTTHRPAARMGQQRGLGAWEGEDHGGVNRLSVRALPSGSISTEMPLSSLRLMTSMRPVAALASRSSLVQNSSQPDSSAAAR